MEFKSMLQVGWVPILVRIGSAARAGSIKASPGVQMGEHRINSQDTGANSPGANVLCH